MGSYSKFGVGHDHRQAALENGCNSFNILLNYSFAFLFNFKTDNVNVILINIGKQLINNYGGQIKMSHHCLDSAYMFFKMAASKRFTVGRKTIYVVGACLYLVSRTEKTPRIFSSSHFH